MHAEGVPIFAQLFPRFGRMGVPRDGARIIAASPKNLRIGSPHLPPGVHVPGGKVTSVPHEATVQEILAVKADVVAAAVRARSAGFDGVEIAAHMCYFYASFLSPRTNWRTDECGGSAENRARALYDLVRAVRLAVRDTYPLGLRMSVNDHTDDDAQGAEGFAEVAKWINRARLGYIALTDGN